MNENLTVEIFSSIDQINPQQWNAMVTGNHPFIKHEFLHALEKHQCVSKRFGWIPKHLVITENSQILGAMPLYEKHNNYGEFVFDQAWEQAWNQIGLPYYPKLVCATPYTPVMGQRFLINPDLSEAKQACVFKRLFEHLNDFCDQQQMSGAHILFANTEQQNTLKQAIDQHTYTRSGYQFHWQNNDYDNFEQFLANLKSKKRNNILRERRSVQQSGITFTVLNGHQATEKDWQNFDFFYQKTFIEKWSTPTLNLAFFKEIGQTLAEHIVLVLAKKEGESIAGALMFKSDTHLYGRHWGAIEEVHNLHFETCYYQGIEYAIKHKLTHFEPGAGGEHKIARGFLPVEIDSFHWLPLNPFGENLERFIQQEKHAVKDYLEDCLSQSPYKKASI